MHKRVHWQTSDGKCISSWNRNTEANVCLFAGVVYCICRTNRFLWWGSSSWQRFVFSLKGLLYPVWNQDKSIWKLFWCLWNVSCLWTWICQVNIIHQIYPNPDYCISTIYIHFTLFMYLMNNIHVLIAPEQSKKKNLKRFAGLLTNAFHYYSLFLTFLGSTGHPMSNNSIRLSNIPQVFRWFQTVPRQLRSPSKPAHCSYGLNLAASKSH